MNTTDEELMAAVARGDINAFEEIVIRHQRSAWCVAYRFMGDAAESEDIAQDAFLRILNAAPRYKPTATFRTYLYRIVARLCFDRTKKKHPSYTDNLPEIPDRASEPESVLISKEREAQVRKALDTLPPKQRMAIVLKYYEGLSYADIAEAMDITVKAVERLLSRARTALQSRLL